MLDQQEAEVEEEVGDEGEDSLSSSNFSGVSSFETLLSGQLTN